MTAEMRCVLDALEALGCDPRSDGQGYSCRCPAHDDQHPSLTVAAGDAQPVLLTCHAGCTVEAILAALGLDWGAICEPKTLRPSSTVPEIVATYDYTDEGGELLFEVCRLEPKSFRQRRPDGNGWSWSTKGVRRVLYRLPAVLDAVERGATIYVTEGEKDADAINQLDPDSTGYVATTAPGGAGKWRDEYTEQLVGAARVVVWADADTPGRDHARKVEASLRARVGRVETVEARTGKDASDHLAAGHGLEDAVRTDASGLVVRLGEVRPTIPEFDAGTILRRRGLHLWFAAPGTNKTYLALLAALEMTQREPGHRLFGIEDFEIRRRWRRVLWLGDEESAGELRARADILARGHGLRAPEGDELLFADASGGDAMLDLRNLPELVERFQPDAIVADPLANLTPQTDEDGRPVKVDLDNAHALGRVCRPLRRLCKTHDLAVLLLHHPNAGGERERGPTAYRGSADLVLHLAREKDSPTLRLDVQKNRDGRLARVQLEPRWSGSRHSTDDPLTVRFVPSDAPPGGVSLPPLAAQLHAVVRAAGPMMPNKWFDAVPDKHRSSKYRARDLLLSNGLVAKDSKGRYTVVEAPITDETEG